MSEMIIKMSLVTGLMCVINVIMWRLTKNRKTSVLEKLLIGLLFGMLAVLSTHFGIDYENMVLNVRDMAPLSAGVFFGPLAGIVSGTIGGVERYIVGEFFGVGSYTAVACGLSCILAGFVSAAFNRFIFHGKKPTAFYAFFIGAVMEVFHMFAVFLTHRDDMNTAFHVVRICAIPMIIFNGVGMLVSAALLAKLSGVHILPARHEKSELTITYRFQFWLFLFSVLLTVSTFFFYFSLQTRQAIQTAEKQLGTAAKEASESLDMVNRQYNDSLGMIEEQALKLCRAVARETEQLGGISALNSSLLDELQQTYSVSVINAVNSEGIVVISTAPDMIGFDMGSDEMTEGFLALLRGTIFEYTQEYMPDDNDSDSIRFFYAGVTVKDGFVQIGLDSSKVLELARLTELASSLTTRHIGDSGNTYIATSYGKIISRKLIGRNLEEFDCMKDNNEYFDAEIDGTKCFCYSLTTDSYRIIAALPYDEVYLSRNISAYETAFADILLFTLMFVLIFILVQRIIVRNLDSINASLNRITRGHLNETITVNSSAEFVSLSRDINATVSTLKRYIAEAENRINEELEFARNIQLTTLPQNFEFPNRDEFRLFASMNTAKEVGGDFYDFFFVDRNKLALVIADVSGKGIPAALFMMRSKATIKGLAEAGTKPGELFVSANKLLCENNEAQMFVSVWLGIIDLETGIMECANAGHEYPVIKRKDSDYELLEDRHGLVLACRPKMKYHEYTVELNEGDTIFVYTDGVPEANNEAEELFGTDRLLESLNSVRTDDPSAILSAVQQDIDEFRGKADQFDDITMLCFRFIKKAGTEPQTPDARTES